MTGIVVAVTASALAVGTGIAVDRLVLPELRQERTTASGPKTQPSGDPQPGPQTETSTEPGTPDGGDDGDGKPRKRGDEAGRPPTADAPTPPLKPMRAPGNPPKKSTEPDRPPTTSGARTRGGSPDGSAGGSAAEAAVVALTNAERAKEGCKPLRVDERLVTAARRHSADMAANGYFDHTSRNGDSPWKRMEAAGYSSPGAENIAKGYATAEAVMKGWMDSPGHRANILNCDLRAIGVGRASGSGGPLWTQDFGWK
ncbi:uncharacterized protein YkwD [Actinomadura pelletieri DSM 43383]|uniref:Uncharacterized protein YkwD n=1 Tax=Actinomadura pelletieri DSM 43383 TaxID=1120940 RepID=A0A495QRX7_9ACTN|nr:CAP domain-containing protein [Actinomadura pelletieri]RKS76131.1 uncharacterized protein YkwD [Actinomadura pelletieri DSM 43383]